MPPIQAPDLKTLTADQVKLLIAYIGVSPQLKAHQWTDIAWKLGIGNGKAAYDIDLVQMKNRLIQPEKNDFDIL